MRIGRGFIFNMDYYYFLGVVRKKSSPKLQFSNRPCDFGCRVTLYNIDSNTSMIEFQCFFRILFELNYGKMFSRYKILILPFVVLLFAGSTLFNDKPFKEEKTTFSKTIPFPYKQESKTQWTKPNWSNKIAKTFPTFICLLTKNKIERPAVFSKLFNEHKIFYTANYPHKHNGRAPPKFS